MGFDRGRADPSARTVKKPAPPRGYEEINVIVHSQTKTILLICDFGRSKLTPDFLIEGSVLQAALGRDRISRQPGKSLTALAGRKSAS